MDRVRRERRIGIISVAGVLLVVGAFWILGYPHYRQYRIHMREAELKKTLERLKLPGGTRPPLIMTDHTEVFKGVCLVQGRGVYFSDATNGQIKAHYEQEFTAHGFIRSPANPKQDSDSLGRFENSQCWVKLKASKGEGPLKFYLILVTSTDISC